MGLVIRLGRGSRDRTGVDDGRKAEGRRRKTEGREPGRRAGMTEDTWGAPAAWLVAHEQLLPTAGDALDVACGTGRHALWLAARDLRVRAMDRDERTLMALRETARAGCLPIDIE